MRKFEILKKIDQFIFSKLDVVKEHPEFQKINEAYAGLEEKVQEFVKMALAASVVVVPVLLIFIFSVSNSSLREDLRMKEEIISMGHEYIQEQALLRSAENSTLGRKLVVDQAEMQGKITAIVNSVGIDTANIQVSNFATNDLAGNIVEATMNLKFSSLSNDNLFNLITNFISREKIKIETVTINKNKATNLLDGLIAIYYFSKDDPSNE